MLRGRSENARRRSKDLQKRSLEASEALKASPEHTNGPPHVYMVLSLIEYLKTQDVGALTETLLEQLHESFVTMSQDDVHQEVPYFTI